MTELVKYVVMELVENKNAVVITEDNDVIKIAVDPKDIGKVIGRQGRIAKSIRTIVKAVGQKTGKKCNVEILDS